MPVQLPDLHAISQAMNPVKLFRPASSYSHTTRTAFGKWTLEVRQDPFTGGASCRLHARSMNFYRTAVIFRLPPKANSYQAYYRIDDGPATAWRSQALAIAAAGIPLGDEQRLNPSNGRLPLPYEAVKSARMVRIQVAANAQPVRFNLDGLDGAVTAALAAGCRDRSMGTWQE